MDLFLLCNVTIFIFGLYSDIGHVCLVCVCVCIYVYVRTYVPSNTDTLRVCVYRRKVKSWGGRIVAT